jgi:hypothetical protein
MVQLLGRIDTGSVAGVPLSIVRLLREARKVSVLPVRPSPGDASPDDGPRNTCATRNNEASALLVRGVNSRFGPCNTLERRGGRSGFRVGRRMLTARQ